jgi:hypothetical protein
MKLPQGFMLRYCCVLLRGYYSNSNRSSVIADGKMFVPAAASRCAAGMLLLLRRADMGPDIAGNRMLQLKRKLS